MNSAVSEAMTPEAVWDMTRQKLGRSWRMAIEVWEVADGSTARTEKVPAAKALSWTLYSIHWPVVPGAVVQFRVTVALVGVHSAEAGCQECAARGFRASG